MRTQLMIMAIVGVIFVAAVAIVVGLVWWLGWMSGLALSLGIFGLLAVLYVWVVKPWHMRWGATDEEVARTMPGDELIPNAGSATRAITIAATPADVWPWLVQIGYGKAGWYSYDWIDNDFKSSADHVLPEYQDLQVGDKILMMPDMGFVVGSIDEERSIVSVLEDGSTSWCLGLYPNPAGGTRLVSRWRPKFDVTPATVAMTALAEPGTFIMEQKMLRTIRDRAEMSPVVPPSTG
ncbi:MAG: hypothetical protein MUQ27_01590 [Acidimicrobiia bacterium]|nr:hypothetical protein [Acidimicrobiia bacterium]